jgi:ABC-type cobalamin transport system permease subunit
LYLHQELLLILANLAIITLIQEELLEEALAEHEAEVVEVAEIAEVAEVVEVLVIHVDLAEEEIVLIDHIVLLLRFLKLIQLEEFHQLVED